MRVCTQCGQKKPDREFPWKYATACHPCTTELAMRWRELPWADHGRFSEETRERMKAAAQKRHSAASRGEHPATKAMRNVSEPIPQSFRSGGLET